MPAVPENALTKIGGDGPGLVITGETSETPLDNAARRMEREMPDKRSVVLEETSHFLPMEKPDEVAKLIVDFAAGA